MHEGFGIQVWKYNWGSRNRSQVPFKIDSVELFLIPFDHFCRLEDHILSSYLCGADNVKDCLIAIPQLSKDRSSQ